MLSVIMPLHNGEKFVGQACQSVFDQPQASEIVIVDDGSQDNSLGVVRSLQAPPHVQLRWISQPQSGPSAARNRGVELAQGKDLVFLDCDDVLLPGAFETLLRARQQAPECAIWGRAWWTDEHLEPRPAKEWTMHMMVLGAILWPRSLWQRVGPLDEALTYSEDTDYFLRCRQAGVNLHKIEDVVLYYRRHSESMTADREAVSKGVVQAFHRLLQRRRQQS